MRRVWFWFASSALVLFCAATARAATVLERSVVHTLSPQGAVREEVRLRVRIDRIEDSRDWSPYYIALDENRELESAKASVQMPDGSRTRIGRRWRDTREISATGAFHSSESYHRIDFPHLPVGAVIHLETVVRAEPYFSTGRIALVLSDAVERQRIEVRGAPAGWRWALADRDDRFHIEENATGVVVISEGLAANEPPELASDNSRRGPMLTYGWGRGETWPAVAIWYEELLSSLPRRPEVVRAAAREVMSKVETQGEQLAALTRFVQEKVRYVAIEVGIGGYRPTAPLETLQRRWGDCKDKSLLLIDLLAEAGIEAHPTLIHASRTARVDTALPDPGQFNHLIVAVPTAQLTGNEWAQARAEEFLFLDPTQTRGGAVWLHPADQDQEVLVVRGARSVLVRTPIRPEQELAELRVNLAVKSTGDAAGGASLELTGGAATAFLDRVAEASPSEKEVALRTLFARLIPGVELGVVSWSPIEGDLPAISLSASVRIQGLVEGEPSRRSLRLPGITATPEARQLSGREEPVILAPGRTRAEWTLALPQGWCLPRSEETSSSNALGKVRQSVQAEVGRVTLTRSTQLNRRWVEPADLPALEELSLAEHRSLRRRLRLRCATN